MLFALLLSNLVLLGHGAPLEKRAVNHPSYRFGYQVGNETTPDFKVHTERWNSTTGVTTGMYKVLQPDGCVRVVHYTADSTGFHPKVTYEGRCHGSISGGQHQQSDVAALRDPPTTPEDKPEKASFIPGSGDRLPGDHQPPPGESDHPLIAAQQVSPIEEENPAWHTPAAIAIDHKDSIQTFDDASKISPEVSNKSGQDTFSLDTLNEKPGDSHSTVQSEQAITSEPWTTESNSTNDSEPEISGRVKSDSGLSYPLANVTTNESHAPRPAGDKHRDSANRMATETSRINVYQQQQQQQQHSVVPTDIRPKSPPSSAYRASYAAPTRSGPGGYAVYRPANEQHYSINSNLRAMHAPVSYGHPHPARYAYARPPSVAYSTNPHAYRQYNHPHGYATSSRAVPANQMYGMRRYFQSVQPATIALYGVTPIRQPARRTKTHFEVQIVG